MNRRVMIVVVAVVLYFGSTIALVCAQGGVTAPPDKDVLQRVLNAWSSLDPSKAAPYYAKDANLAFFDIAPRKFAGWAAYEKGARDLLKDLKSLSMKLLTDAEVHTSGNLAWTTATVDVVMANKDGSSQKADARWTTVWEKRGNNWLIVHDHFSAPLPEAPPPPAQKK